MIQIQFPAEKQGRNAAVDSCAGQCAHCLVPPATQQRCHTGHEGDMVDKVMEQVRCKATGNQASSVLLLASEVFLIMTGGNSVFYGP